MTPSERNELCERHKLAVLYSAFADGYWYVSFGESPFDTLSESPHRDTAIDLAADRLAEMMQERAK